MTEYDRTLDVPFIRALGIYAGLKKYPELLKDMPRNTMDVIHEWNGALKHNVKYHCAHIGNTARALGHIPAGRPLAAVIDNVAAPYRTYQYAKRFVMSYRFVEDICRTVGATKGRVNVVNYGRGLAPMDFLLSENGHKASFFGFDKEPVNNVFYDTWMELVGFTPQYYNIVPRTPITQNDVYLSLGTYPYLALDDQAEKLKSVMKKYPNFFIELDALTYRIPSDCNIIQKMGMDVHTAWGWRDLGKIVTETKRVIDTKYLFENTDKKLLDRLDTASEMYVFTKSKSFER